jgi:hypothetical protein
VPWSGPDCTNTFHLWTSSFSHFQFLVLSSLMKKIFIQFIGIIVVTIILIFIFVYSD